MYFVITDLVGSSYIDLNDEANPSIGYQFTNTEETDSPFFVWAEGQPNDPTHNCVYIHVAYNGLSAGMNDYLCSREYSRVCEYECE